MADDTNELTSAEPAVVPWTVTDVVKGVGLLLLALVVLGTIIGGIALLFDTAEGEASTTAIMFLAALGELLMLLAAWRFSVFKYRAGWRSLGFRHPTTFGNVLWRVVVAFVVTFLVSFVYLSLMDYFSVEFFQPPEIYGETDETPAGLAAYALGAVVVAPPAEEAFFRGFVFPGIGRRYNMWWGAVVSAALFALAHTSVALLLPMFVMGLLLAWVYLRTRSIWPCIAFHAAWNAWAVTGLLLTVS